MRCVLIALTTLAMSAAHAQPAKPAFVARGEPGAGHAALKPLIGRFSVEKSTFVAGGTPERPIRATISCTREAIAGGRFLRDVTEGVVGGNPYYRIGLLGYSNEDKRFEWTTADGLNANMMIYLGKPGSGPRLPIEVSGRFTDQGLIGPDTAGRSVAQRTVITIESNDRHVVELYFTPPGRREFLADRAIYTRVRRP